MKYQSIQNENKAYVQLFGFLSTTELGESYSLFSKNATAIYEQRILNMIYMMTPKIAQKIY